MTPQDLQQRIKDLESALQTIITTWDSRWCNPQSITAIDSAVRAADKTLKGEK